ncbi:hypothetical protein SUGI_1033500 [Cryptomeria japonica]|nr:hypothetical protein SUGI_1033500 [Cryptomeria japonica]
MASDDDEYRKANLLSRAEWHPDTVARLIDGYGEKCANIKGYLKTKDWEEIVKYVNIQCEGSKVPKTMKQCREKIDSLKRRYKLEKRRVEIRGSNHVNWSFFDKLDDIMRNLRRSGNISEGHSFEVAEALDFEGFEGDSRSDLMISNNKERAVVGFGLNSRIARVKDRPREHRIACLKEAVLIQTLVLTVALVPTPSGPLQMLWASQ